MDGAEVDSTGNLLSKIDNLNNGVLQEVKKRTQNYQASVDRDQSLPPSKGTRFKFVCESPGDNVESHTRRRIEVLRSLKNRSSTVPNLHAKLQATRFLDEGEGKEAIKRLTKNRKRDGQTNGQTNTAASNTVEPHYNGYGGTNHFHL